MDKVTKKNPDKYVPQVIDALKENYGFSSYYIRQCVAGRRSGITPDKIRKKYKEITNELEKQLSNFKNQ